MRGFVFARLANYVEGHAAVRPELAEAVASLLKEPKLPKVSAMGQGGAGEILGLAPLFYRLAERFELGEKESLALVNGSPCGTALIADAVIAMERRLELTEQVLALVKRLGERGLGRPPERVLSHARPGAAGNRGSFEGAPDSSARRRRARHPDDEGRDSHPDRIMSAGVWEGR